jgi:pyruvate,orthophosphate dikinase
MTEEGNLILLKGDVLSMPSGNYEASLIENGIELSRMPFQKGQFKLAAQRERVNQAKRLQIDIIQAGRHIGTFLLKKEASGGIYISALELSEELRGVDFKLLTVPLRDKVGLLRQAEEIITQILSAKKDWASFSEKLNGFIQDFFWSARQGFYEAFSILSHFSAKSAKHADKNLTAKPVANLLACIELPLHHERDNGPVQAAVGVWLRELEEADVDLSPELHRSVEILESVHSRLPRIIIGPVLHGFFGSVRKKLSRRPAFSSAMLTSLHTRLSRESYSMIEEYGQQAKDEVFARLAHAEQDLLQGRDEKALSFLGGLNPAILDERSMVVLFYQIVADAITQDSADVLATAVIKVFDLVPVLPRGSEKDVKSSIITIIGRLISTKRNELCISLLDAVARTGSPLNEEIVMDAEIARAILVSGDSALIGRYSRSIAAIPIPAPMIRELSTETWAELANPLHLERLTKFMEILQVGDDRFRNVLEHVIVNLYVSGVFIPDDRLFQRRISSYLNSPAMKGHFLLNYLLLQKLPVYFNEVGAVSTIRDYSTAIDAWGNDPVLYFLRKQVHVNASNYNVRLLEKIISSWVFNDRSLLKDAVPPEVYEAVKPELLDRYSRAIKPLFKKWGFLDTEGLHFEKLRAMPGDAFKPSARYGQVDEIPSKVMLLCRLYQEVEKKYSVKGGRAPDTLQDAGAALRDSIEKMEKLAGILQAPEKTVAQESLYFKRHIAFGIPSVLGTYHEPKFDALSDFLRYGDACRVLFEKFIAAMETEAMTGEHIKTYIDTLAAAHRLLALHGITNRQIEEIITVIENNRLRLSQVFDLLKIWQKELGWMVFFFNQTFHAPIARILKLFPQNELPEHIGKMQGGEGDFKNRAADIVLRDIIASVPGLMESDRIVERIITSFRSGAAEGEDLIHETGVKDDTPFYDIFGLHDNEAMALGPVLGGKAKNLVYLHNRGFHVPAGAVLSSRLGRDLSVDRLRPILKEAVGIIEARTGKRFGGTENPLFLSVRSGSYVSMPGILSSILYCGMNRETVQALISETGDKRFAWDSYRRFVEHYATTVLCLDPVIDRIKKEFMNKGGPGEPETPDAENLKKLVDRYVAAVHAEGKNIPDDVFEQLLQSVLAIYRSWNGKRAEQFRKATMTSEHWGTSVSLMQMVYGNARGSGASVLFTRNPFTQEQEIYGETREAATGDELVFGRVLNLPLSRKQAAGQDMEKAVFGKSLEETDENLYLRHLKLGREIEQAMGGLPQEVEITYVKEPDGNRKLFVLQTRRMEFTIRNSYRFDEICSMESRVIGRGIGAHGGAVSGVVSFTRSRDHAIRLAKEMGLPVILLRTTANTEDVALMPVIRGMITSSGGVTSHAAVLAQKFNVNTVVACTGLSIKTDQQGQPYALIDHLTLKEGALVSIDASTGLVFSGLCPVTRPRLR